MKTTAQPGKVSKAPKQAKKAAKPRVEPDARFAPVAAAFAQDRAVTAGVMMASFGLKVNGKIFAMSCNGELVAKLPRARVDELVERGEAVRFDPGHGRPMKEWIAVAGHEDTWVALAREAYAFVKAG